MRAKIIRIERVTGGWCFPSMSYRIKVFRPYGAGWEHCADSKPAPTISQLVENWRSNGPSWVASR